MLQTGAQGKEPGHLGKSQSRATTCPHGKEPVEVVWVLPRGNPEAECLLRWAWENLSILMNELKEVAGKRENWTSILGTPTLNSSKQKNNQKTMDGWLDKVMEEN